MNELRAMSPGAVAAVASFESQALTLPQVDITTEHVFHAGMYARTIKIPADVVIAGALIKIATVLIVNGDCLVYTDEGTIRVTGHNVMCGAAGRKQAFAAITDTYLTMLFPTEAKTVDEAEAEFTDEADNLGSRRGTNIIRGA